MPGETHAPDRGDSVLTRSSGSGGGSDPAHSAGGVRYPDLTRSPKDLLDIPGFYQTRNGNFWVAVHGSEVIGTVALLDIGNDQAALRKMFVKAAFRGRERGVAERLLATLLQWCRARGVCEVLLGTTAQFLAAHRFYEKNGFTDIPQSQLPASFPVMSVDTKFYRHVLAGR